MHKIILLIIILATISQINGFDSIKLKFNCDKIVDKQKCLDAINFVDNYMSLFSNNTFCDMKICESTLSFCSNVCQKNIEYCFDCMSEVSNYYSDCMSKKSIVAKIDA